MHRTGLSTANDGRKRSRALRWFETLTIRAMRRRGPESGATLVEFSIIAGLFFAVVLGTLDFSMSMFDLNSTNFATRSQVRSASNGEWSSSNSCAEAGDLTFLPGDPPLGTDGKSLLCSVKLRTQLGAKRVRVRVRFEDPDFPDRVKVKPQIGKSLVMCTMTSMRSISGVYAPLLKDKVLTSIARSRIERDLSIQWTTLASNTPMGPLAAETISEAPFSGSDWEFCNKTSIGNADVGDAVVPASNDKCKVTWTSAQDVDSRHYRLDGAVINMTRDPWNQYQVLFTLPVGHRPESRTFEEGELLNDNGVVDTLNPGRVTWTFEKKAPGGPGSPQIYGIPLADGDISPGNGVSLTVTILPNILVPSIPVMNGDTKIGIPDPDFPVAPTDQFAQRELLGCS